ncbi:hypothetical protein ABK040_000057 [Willaertia magna]
MNKSQLVELFLKYSWILFLVWGVLNILTSFLGVVIYGVYTELRGPIVLQNQFLGVWLCSMLFFFSIQTVYYSLKPKDYVPKHISFILNAVYFTIVTLESFILFIVYAIGEMRRDAIAWTFLILTTNILNIVIVIIKLVRQKRELNIEGQGDCYSSLNQSVKTAVKVPYIIFIVINTFLKCLVFIFMALLINGGVTLANRVRFPPRGDFVKVPLSGGRAQSIHYLCDGPRNNSIPVFMIEGDFSHGMADYYGIQIALKELGRRSCIWDKPGLGYSDYLYADQYDESSFYHNFITSIGETGPFIFVGWGGGGQIIYKYALLHPEMVYSLTFLDVYPDNIEFISERDLKNLTQPEYENFYNREMAGRQALLRIINGLGVPWGLMPIFVPSGNSWPESLREEKNWFFLTEKTWITQKYMLDTFTINPKNYYATPLPNSNITVHLIATKHNDNYVKKNRCNNVSSEKCDYFIRSNNYYIEAQKNMLSFNSVTYCSDDACNLGYYIYDNPRYSAKILNELYNNN